MRTPLIAANWKMHKTIAQAEAFFNEFATAVPEGREVLIGVGGTLLTTAVAGAQASGTMIAAQNMYAEDEGAFTGELSPLQLKDTGATHVILGHSERRHIFGETNELLNQKMHAAQRHGIIPVYCVGETIEERKGGRAEQVVQFQIEQGFAGLNTEFVQQVVIAYEPVWAIGTGETATPEQAEEMHAFIRGFIPEETRVLYGGSVKPANCNELMAQPNIDGFLVGGASLEPASFTEIVNVTMPN